MNQTHEFEQARRRRDGSIDFDHYRARAIALRGQAIRDAATLKVAGRFTLVASFAVIALAVVLSAPAPQPRNDLGHIAGAWSNGAWNSGAGAFGEPQDGAKRQALRAGDRSVR